MRIDLLLVHQNLAASRTLAQDLIRAGHVYLDTGLKQLTILKPNFEIPENEFGQVRVRPNALQKYVSRGGLKLEGALTQLNISVEAKMVLDVGQSTGGFTDCLLTRGARQVTGVDVGRDQLHESLKNRPEVVYFESLHVAQLDEHSQFSMVVPPQGFDLIVADVSFISLTKVIPFLKKYLGSEKDFLFLVKPQFEAGPDALDKNGLVKDEKYYEVVQNNVTAAAIAIFGHVEAYIQSSLPGKDGNQEFFIYGQNRI